MSSALERADLWLIERVFEPAAWRIARWCGTGIFNIARLTLAAWLAGVLVNAAHERSGSAVTLAVVIAVMFPFRLRDIAKIEDAVERKGMANPEKHRFLDVFFRGLILFSCGGMGLAGIALAVASLATVGQTDLNSTMTITNFAVALHCYFSACESPPPVEETETDDELVHSGAL